MNGNLLKSLPRFYLLFYGDYKSVLCSVRVIPKCEIHFSGRATWKEHLQNKKKKVPNKNLIHWISDKSFIRFSSCVNEWHKAVQQGMSIQQHKHKCCAASELWNYKYDAEVSIVTQKQLQTCTSRTKFTINLYTYVQREVLKWQVNRVVYSDLNHASLLSYAGIPSVPKFVAALFAVASWVKREQMVKNGGLSGKWTGFQLVKSQTIEMLTFSIDLLTLCRRFFTVGTGGGITMCNSLSTSSSSRASSSFSIFFSLSSFSICCRFCCNNSSSLQRNAYFEVKNVSNL